MFNNTKRLFIIILIISFSFAVSINTVFICSAILLTLFFANQKRFEPDVGDVLILLAMFTWKMFSGEGLISAIIMGLGFTAIYHVGKCLVSETDISSADLSAYAMVVLAGCLFIKGLVNYSYLLRFTLPDYEMWPNWRGITITRTQHEFYLILIASLFISFIILGFESHKIYLWGAMLSIIAVSMGVASTGRLAFFCSLCTAMAVMTGFGIETKLYKSKGFRISTSIAVVALVVFSTSLALNIGGLYDAYSSSMWSGSGGIIHNTRFTLMFDSIKQLKDYPWGRNNTLLTEYNGTKTPYAHNTWLDIGRSGGVIPLILSIGFTVYNTICMIRIWFNTKDISKYILIASFIGISLYNMTEPAIKSDPLFWGIEVYIGGILSGVNSNRHMC